MKSWVTTTTVTTELKAQTAQVTSAMSGVGVPWTATKKALIALPVRSTAVRQAPNFLLPHLRVAQTDSNSLPAQVEFFKVLSQPLLIQDSLATLMMIMQATMNQHFQTSARNARILLSLRLAMASRLSRCRQMPSLQIQRGEKWIPWTTWDASSRSGLLPAWRTRSTKMLLQRFLKITRKCAMTSLAMMQIYQLLSNRCTNRQIHPLTMTHTKTTRGRKQILWMPQCMTASVVAVELVELVVVVVAAVPTAAAPLMPIIIRRIRQMKRIMIKQSHPPIIGLRQMQ